MSKNRVTFSRPTTDDSVVPFPYLNARTVYFDGEAVGTLYGAEPSPHNEIRPTAFIFERNSGEPVPTNPFDRLETAREGIARIYLPELF